jgi:putative DNA primase/helicase
MANVLLEAALDYARMGWHVFPCNQENKQPLVKGGFYGATTSEAQIRKWWSQFPDALIAVRTGKDSGVFVLDIDCKNEAGGYASLSALEEKYGKMPPTLMATTPSGGKHYFFIYPTDGTELRNTGGKIGSGIDTRGEGGYAIVAPSRLASGGEYRWIQD